MDRELTQDYLKRSGMSGSQAEALSRILAEMATKSDLLVLEQKIVALEHRFETKLAELEARLTWRIFAAMVVLATIMTLLDLFVD